MKVIKLKSLTAFAFSFIALFTGCTKDDGPIPKEIGIEDVPAMTMNLELQKKDNVDTIKLGSQAAFNGKFKVGLIFPGAKQPTKVDIVVRKNGVATSIRLFKADVTSFPTSFSATAADITTLFGAPIALNDTYDFAPDIFVGSKKYEAYPLVGAGNGAGVIGMNSIGFYESVRFIVKN
jgi:hypothetical protein